MEKKPKKMNRLSSISKRVEITEESVMGWLAEAELEEMQTHVLYDDLYLDDSQFDSVLEIELCKPKKKCPFHLGETDAS